MRSGRSTRAWTSPGWRRSRSPDDSWPNGRGLDRHSGRARHQVKLELDELRRAEVIVLGPDTRDAVAQAALQRSHGLPFQPVDRVAGRERLGDGRSGEMLVPIVVVAIGAAEVELSLSLHEEVAALRHERL